MTLTFVLYCPLCKEKYEHCSSTLCPNCGHDGVKPIWACKNCKQSIPQKDLYPCSYCGEYFCGNCLNSDGMCNQCAYSLGAGLA